MQDSLRGVVRGIAVAGCLWTPTTAIAAPPNAAPATETTSPKRPKLQEPSGPTADDVSDETSDANAGGVAAPTPPPESAASGDLEAGSPPESDNSASAPVDSAPAAPAPAEPVPPPEENLLAPSEPESPTSSSTDEQRNVLPQAGEHDVQTRRYFRSLYRPESNPGRLHVSARGQFAILGTNQDGGGGRTGGVSASVGQTWNAFGYGVEATFLGGQVRYQETTGGPTVQNNILVGGGPVIGLGRLGLVRRSMLDLQVGYNFFYGVTNPLFEGDPAPDAIAPHGPHARFNAGFQLETRHGTKLHQFLGVSAGWQGLFHSLAGSFPTANGFTFAVYYAFL